MRVVITVIGKDMVGILARVAAVCADSGVNITEVSQSVLQDLFAMIMLADMSQAQLPFDKLKSMLASLGTDLGLSIHVMHEDIFNSMHRI